MAHSTVPGDLSDFETKPPTDAALGELGLFTSEDGVIRKRRQVVIQLALSLSTIAGVAAFV